MQEILFYAGVGLVASFVIFIIYKIFLKKNGCEMSCASCPYRSECNKR